MTVALFVVGAATALVAIRALGPVLASPALARQNHRGASLPTAAGICLITAVLAIESVRAAVDPAITTPRLLILAAVVGFGLLGLLDDVLGDAAGADGDRGLAGHLRAAASGRLTTGFVKLAGGAGLAVVLAAAAGDGSVARTIADGALIALAANLANLFDRAPARTVKWALVVYAPLAWVAGAGAVGSAIAPVAGATVGMLPGDARERFMLGDTGANAVGAALGTAAVLALGGDARVVIAVVLLGLNLLSEAVSFSRIIAAVPPLRAFDRLGRLAIAGAVVLGTVLVATPTAGAQAGAGRRVFVISLPGLTWAEVQHADLPVLGDLFAESALADLAPRSVRHSSRPGDAYLTIGGGTRAIGDPGIDGEVLPPDADYAGEPASGVFQRRTGDAPIGAALTLWWPTFERANAREPYDIELGLLADTLHEEGVATAVVANADGSDDAAVSRERQAALAFADGAGRLSSGVIDDRLLLDDPLRPFGVHLDNDRVLEAVDESLSSNDRAVVLIEDSDLARTLRYRSLVDSRRYAEIRAEALRDADALVGDVLARVDPARDAVMVLAPYFRSSRSDLTVLSLRAPGMSAGYLGSASTQRAGIVTLVDVAPTILDLFGIGRPIEMEGRAVEVEGSSASVGHRIDRLVDINAASRFRENLLTPSTIVAVLVLAGVLAAAVVTVVDERSRRWRRAIAFAALADLAIVPVSYLARGFPLQDLGLGFYWTFVVAGSVAVATLATVVGRRAGSALASLAVVLGLSVLVLAGDVMTGSNLHLSAAFGYSPTGNSRLYGISNYSFGLFSVASCILASLVAHRWPTTRGRVAALALLGATLVVLGVPTWGSDVGGIIAFTPTILVFASVLLRRRPTIRFVLVVGAATVVAVAAFGLADLARPAGDRAHLGRLFERVADEGLEPLLSIMQRKLAANLRVSVSSFWVAAIPMAVGAWAFLRRWRTKPLAALHARVPSLHAGLLAGAVVAVLGSLVNDSGAIVGGVAALAMATSLIHLTMWPEAADR